MINKKRKKGQGKGFNRQKQRGRMANDEVMTVTEVAKMLKLCKNTVYEYVKAGKIPATHCGNMLRFSKRQVFEALEAGFPVVSVKVGPLEKPKKRARGGLAPGLANR